MNIIQFGFVGLIKIILHAIFRIYCQFTIFIPKKRNDIAGTTDKNLGISRTEAQGIINAYLKEIAAVGEYMEKVIAEAREKEYVETILGRRRYLRDINSRNATMRGFAERNTINAPIQGSAADMIKVAMINIHAWMRTEKLQSKMLLQVHDELVFDMYQSELGLMERKIPEFMKSASKLPVPMEVGLGFGKKLA